MQSWEAPRIPPVPGEGLVPRLRDTVTGDVVPVAVDITFTMYVCGITPYDAAHIGHAATYVTYDTVQRVARDAGLSVTYVQNVTDVDDPLLERAARDGHTWHLLAEREIGRFREDMQALAVIPPDRYDGVVESMPLIVEWIEGLRDRGAAYRLDDDWYYSVAADSGFGGVSNLDRESMLAQFAERGGDPGREGKKDPLDALLWAGRRPGEPWWESSLGPGRPGWHVECVAIAEQGLGPSFDLQGGGSDLVFPHHEMCASIARASGRPFARVYSHVGMVALDGEKMSKSKGNLEFVGRLREAGHDPRAVRLAIQAHHYRNDWEWSASLLVRAEERLARWSEAVARRTSAPAEPLIAALRATLADDLRTPDALAAVDEWAAEDGVDIAAPGAVRDAVDALLGVRL